MGVNRACPENWHKDSAHFVTRHKSLSRFKRGFKPLRSKACHNVTPKILNLISFCFAALNLKSCCVLYINIYKL